ncbi:MAG: MaoC family dehydratase N-terminal domain-containing protein [Candidatus Lokiarchaeota archaeon]|nr:MaoC family dehydratase N-terminal domain-containing protein [Candidatus Lokiarchaeota archaeon]
MGLTSEEEKQSEQYQIFIGKQLNKSIHRVKGKNMVEFAEALGDTNPKYVKIGMTADGKPDYSTIIAHPSYPNCFTVDAAFDIVNWKYPLKEGETEARKLITNYGKVLHTAQSYDYTKAEVPIQHGQKLYSTGYLEKAYIQKGRLWLQSHIDTHTKDGKLVVQTKVMVVIREGGF